MIEEKKAKKANTRHKSSGHGRFMNDEQMAKEDPTTVQTVIINRAPSVKRAVKAFVKANFEHADLSPDTVYSEVDVAEMLTKFGEFLLKK